MCIFLRMLLNSVNVIETICKNCFRFDLKTYDNDIALLKLRRPIIYSDQVSPVCLPEQNNDVTPGTVCTVTGWGNPGKYMWKFLVNV